MTKKVIRLVDPKTKDVEYAIDRGRPYLLGPFYDTREEAEAALALETETYTVPRDGKRALHFEGRLLGEASSYSDQGPYQPPYRRTELENCWIELEIYRTKAGRYVCAIARLSRWDGEQESATAIVADDPTTLLERLQSAGEDVANLAREALEKGGVEAPETIE